MVEATRPGTQLPLIQEPRPTTGRPRTIVLVDRPASERREFPSADSHRTLVHRLPPLSTRSSPGPTSPLRRRVTQLRLLFE